MTLQLRYHPLSSYSRKVSIGMDLRGDKVTRQTVNALEGELRRPEFRTLNPFGKMPVLETDEGSIYESTSILEWLEARGPRRLIPQGQEWRARHFDRLGDLYLMDPLGKYFWDKSDEVRNNAETRTGQAWGVWTEALSDGRPFICGDEITLADLSAAVAAQIAETEGVSMPDAIRKYQARLEAHPAVKTARDASLPFVEATKPMRVKKP
ncbi:MAG: glutathione S-transferase family protein [Polyangiales bacterium]